MNPTLIIYSVYALIAVLIIGSIRVWYMKWSQQRLYKKHWQENIDAEREWNAKRMKPSAKPDAPTETPEA